MKKYNIHFEMNCKEHEFIINAMNESCASDACYEHNAFGEEGEETYKELYIEFLGDCEEE